MNLNQLEGYFTKKVHDRAKVIVDTALCETVKDLMYYSPVGQPNEWYMSVPLDYKPGKYKANWQHSIGAKKTDILDARDDSIMDSESVTSKKLQQSIKANKLLFTTHYLTNNVEYAQDIEYGCATHNPQAQHSPIAVAGLVSQNISTYIDKAKQASK
jgi:hypothetical protein